MRDADDTPQWVVKPVDEDINCPNHQTWQRDGRDTSANRFQQHIPLMTAMQRERSQKFSTVPREVRAANDKAPKKLLVRLVAYHHLGGEPGVLMTSLTGAAEHPAAELLLIYHKRWEIEVAFDELKTHMLLRKEALRSKTVDGTYQDFWALMLVYNLVRREMATVAASKGVCPSRISFTGALWMIHNFFAAAAIASMPGVLPRELAELEEQLGGSMILPPRRSERRYPRQVKIKMSNYKKAPPRHVTAA